VRVDESTCRQADRIFGSVRFHSDNAAMESFFNMLQKNVLDRRR
jgi:hypothetical protein